MMDTNATRKVCVVTSTRADWGLLQPLALALRACPGIDLRIIATNMHLLPEYGMTLAEIENAGFEIAERVPMPASGDNEQDRATAMAQCLQGMSVAFARQIPDAVILLGDRYEMLAVAAAAALMHIPIIHIAGGEISEGANDDSFRHAITKLSRLHLTATEPYRRRVIQLGENPDTVVNTGAVGVWNALNINPCALSEIEDFVGMQLQGRKVAVITYHPATNDSSLSPRMATRELFKALDAFPELALVITYPNNDAGGRAIIEEIQSYAAANPGRVVALPSLGMRRYHSLLRHAALVVGNSSSGIVEVPSYHIPTVDIGIRQRGRIAADSVIHCGTSASEISAAIARALSMDCSQVQNPYYHPDTLGLMLAAVTDFLKKLPLEPKTFHDLP